MAGLQAQLSVSSFSTVDKGKEEKGKSPSKARDFTGRINLMKVQQGFGVLSVALASHALKLMSALLEDVSFEAEEKVTNVEPVQLDISVTATALQRAATFFNAAPLNHLLFYLATISYRKVKFKQKMKFFYFKSKNVNFFVSGLFQACTLKRVQKHPLEGDTLSQSDSTTYYEDIISCSESTTDEGKNSSAD